MIRKTYGVSGLMDWTTQIKAGKGTVSVHFTGGALTAYGVTPAKFSTSNIFFQNIIENSEPFKSGRIALLGEMEVPDDAATKATKARLAAKAAAMPVKEELMTKEESQIPAEDPTSDVEQTTAEPQDEQSQEDTAGNIVKVADKPDAIEYLKENFPEKGYTSVKLRTKTAFEAACKECGVNFVFTA